MTCAKKQNKTWAYDLFVLASLLFKIWAKRDTGKVGCVIFNEVSLGGSGNARKNIVGQKR